MSPGMCACRDTDPACPRVLGAPRERVCIFSVPGAVVMISPGVTATTSGVDPTDGVNGCDGGGEEGGKIEVPTRKKNYGSEALGRGSGLALAWT